MIDKKKIQFGMFFVFVILLISLVSSYTLTNAQYSQFQGSDLFGLSASSLQVNPSMCAEGQDFVVQIAPFGCTPAVVRTDLLEEQEVPVYCQLSATKINPLIDVKAISGISVLGDYPPEVSAVGFLPARAALGLNSIGLESSIMQNVGYAVIKLKQQPNESALTNCEKTDFGEVCYVEGELRANIKYDVKNAFGIGTVTHTLPQFTDSEWADKQTQYSFWNAKGYLRAEDITDNSATISVYDNTKKIQSVGLEVGKTSENIYLPGYTCLSSLQLKLNGLESPDTRIKLKINEDYIEVKKGEKFLDDRCSVTDMYDAGAFKKATINCNEDDSGLFSNKAYDLSIAPKVKLSIGTEEKDYSVGDFLYSYTQQDSARKYYVYLGYISSESGRDEDIQIGIISIPEERNNGKLTDAEIAYVGKMSKAYTLEWKSNVGKGTVGNLLKNVFTNAWSNINGAVSNLYTYIADGKQVRFIDYNGNVNVMGEESNAPKPVFGDREVKVLGFAEPVNVEFDSTSVEQTKARQYYDLAEKDYQTLLDDFASDKNEVNTEYGLTALVQRIWLNSDLGQKRTVLELCDQLKSTYTNTTPYNVDDYCNGLEISNQGTSSTLVFVNGKTSRITLSDIVEPTLDEFSAEVTVRGPNGKIETIPLRKNQPYYLEGFRYGEDESITVNIGGNSPVSYKYNGQKKEWQWLSEDGKTYNSVNQEHYKALYKTLNVDLIGKDFVEGMRVINAAQNILLETESIELLDLDAGKAKVKVSVWDKDTLKQVKDTLISGSNTLVLNEPQSFGSDYSFILSKVNLKKEAKVTIIPKIQNVGSETNFTFKIGIEKRGIQLTPSQTIAKIEDLNKTIKKWNDTGEKVGDAVDVFKNACLVGGAALVIKNFLANTGGKGLARQDVMNGKGGWKERCQDLVNKKTYSTIDQCYSAKAADIEKDVTTAFKHLQNQNQDIKTRESGITTNGEVDQDKFMSLSIPAAKTELNKDGAKEALEGLEDSKGNPIDVDKILNYDSWKNDGTFNQGQIRDIEYNARILNDADASPELKSSANQTLRSILGTVNSASEVPAAKGSFSSETGFPEVNIGTTTKNTNKITFSKDVSLDDVKVSWPVEYGLSSDQKVQNFIDESTGNKYVLTLDADNVVTGTYKVVSSDFGTNDLEKVDGINPLNLAFQKRDASSYKNNQIKSPEVKYYETAPYDGMPAIVPVDVKNGWYASIKQTVPITSGISSYDKSGRVSSFYLCNVGTDGSMDGTSKDDCMLINTGTGQPYNVLPGMSQTEAKTLIANAIKAVDEASTKHQTGISQISILGQVMKVGSPAADSSGMQCQDFMSPQDCKILFNLCDPVICPSDRCDLGGDYPVKDPIQTGIIGGLVLCLPNWNEGIYVPVCLSGIKAGIDGLVSVYGSYRDCLQESLDTGKTVGICDEMHSVYLCEFFWKQALPLVEVGLPKLIAAVAGQTTAKGGGEYLGVQNAWDNSKKSVTYFSQTYAASAFTAFKARSTEQIGSDVCKNFASGIIPNLEIADAITELDTPYQFTGRFDEIPFSSATNPPTSQYKVFYHIYAGKSDSGYYKVYLKGSSTSSFYQDTSSSRLVAQGYMNVGETVSETKDFTAPSGYKELCIEVNGQQECGFKEVSTSFALDYVKDKYIEQQTTQTDIQTEQECVSGSASAYSLLNPNVQQGVEGLVNPEIYNYGIVRVCSTNNPGEGTDPLVGTNNSRWRQVGICGNQNLKCWLDTSNIDEITTLKSTEKNILSNVTTNVLDTLSKEEIEDINKVYEDISYGRITDQTELLSKINGIIDKVYLNNQKARLYLLRGQAYQQMAKDIFDKVMKGKLEKEPVEPLEEPKEMVRINFQYKTITVRLRFNPNLKSGIWEWDSGADDWIYVAGIDINVYSYDTNSNDDKFKDIIAEFVNTYGLAGKDYSNGYIYLQNLQKENPEVELSFISGGPEEPAVDPLEGFSDAEKEIILNAQVPQDCKKCGPGANLCDEDECIAIGDKISQATNGVWGCEFIRFLNINPCRQRNFGETVLNIQTPYDLPTLYFNQIRVSCASKADGFNVYCELYSQDDPNKDALAIPVEGKILDVQAGMQTLDAEYMNDDGSMGLTSPKVVEVSTQNPNCLGSSDVFELYRTHQTTDFEITLKFICGDGSFGEGKWNILADDGNFYPVEQDDDPPVFPIFRDGKTWTYGEGYNRYKEDGVTINDAYIFASILQKAETQKGMDAYNLVIDEMLKWVREESLIADDYIKILDDSNQEKFKITESNEDDTDIDYRYLGIKGKNNLNFFTIDVT